MHPSSYIATSSIVENGVLIEPHVVISSQSRIGFGVYIKRGSLIGSGTVIKDNVSIGNHTIIGIGSVVTKDIPSNCIAYGNPCRIVEKTQL